MSPSNNYTQLQRHHEFLSREIERLKPDRHKHAPAIAKLTGRAMILGKKTDFKQEVTFGHTITDQDGNEIATVRTEDDAKLFMSRIGPLEEADRATLKTKLAEIEAMLDKHPGKPK